MTFFNAIGAPQLVLILLIPVAIFFLGYYFGKKAGYLKRVKETEKNQLSNSTK
jgi:Tfp pilus assembly protein PilO